MEKLIKLIHNRKKGFTLVEVLIVLVIIAIIASISIPSFVGYIDRAQGNAVLQSARTFYEAFQTALSEKYINGLSATVVHKNDEDFKQPNGTYSPVYIGKITNWTFYYIKKGNDATFNNRDATDPRYFDKWVGQVAYKLMDGSQYNYMSGSPSGQADYYPTTDGKVYFSLTYDKDAKILKFEYAQNGYFVKFMDGAVTVEKNGRFAHYTVPT